jgi:hypothetical protein
MTLGPTIEHPAHITRVTTKQSVFVAASSVDSVSK